MARQTYDSSWLRLGDVGEVFGFCFGADYCAEHEQGIEPLKALVGCNASSDSAIAEKIINVNKENTSAFAYVQRRGTAADIFACSAHIGNLVETVKVRSRGAKESGAGWNEKSFYIFAVGSEDKANLSLLANSIYPTTEKRVAIIGSRMLSEALWSCGLGTKKIDAIHGPCLVFLDRLPKQAIQSIEASIIDAYVLDEAASKVNIGKVLSDHGINWFALTPAWIRRAKDNSDIPKTKYDFWYWFNPMKQKVIPYGWFTVEQLIELAGEYGEKK